MTTEILLTVEQHTDTETGINHIGEIDFGIKIGPLENYLKRYRYEGKTEIIKTLAFLIYKVEEEYMRVIRESPSTPPPSRNAACGAGTNLTETKKA